MYVVEEVNLELGGDRMPGECVVPLPVAAFWSILRFRNPAGAL